MTSDDQLQTRIYKASKMPEEYSSFFILDEDVIAVIARDTENRIQEYTGID